MNADKLGRRHAPDPRDRAFMVERPRKTARPYRYWYSRFNVDQTGPTCVANSAAHFLGDSPKTHTLAALDARAPAGYESFYSGGERGFRGFVYDQAQQVDEWPDTPPADGTSVRAGFKVLQSLGLIGEYRWLVTSDDPRVNLDGVIAAILEESPVVVGTDFYNSMFDASPGEEWIVDPSSGLAGGHAYVLDGANVSKRRVRVQTWGGHYWLSFDSLSELLAGNGEAAVALEA